MRHAVALVFAIPCLVFALVLGVLASSARAEDMVDTREQAFRTEAEKAFILDQMRLLRTHTTKTAGLTHARGHGEFYDGDA